MIPKVGRVAMVEHLRFGGRINEVTVTAPQAAGVPASRWRQESHCLRSRMATTVGVDVGIEDLAVCSGGAVVDNPRVLKPALRCLRRLGKTIARSQEHPRQDCTQQSSGAAVCPAGEAARPHSQRQERVASQGHNGDSQVGGPGGDS